MITKSQTTTGLSVFYQFSPKWLRNLRTLSLTIICYKRNVTCHQSGNRKHHSTETLSLLVTNYIFKAMDNKQVTVMVLIDLSKAFDSICHRRLLCKIQQLGISDNALNWFQSYLSDREQSMQIATSLSGPLTLTHGVPQGSILGPMLFSLGLIERRYQAIPLVRC